jgi:hypothetical protein
MRFKCGAATVPVRFTYASKRIGLYGIRTARSARTIEVLTAVLRGCDVRKFWVVQEKCGIEPAMARRSQQRSGKQAGSGVSCGWQSLLRCVSTR